ncbi:MAG: hypothetical protein LBN04_05385 [Oscillospiraceae bacterium]|nr:hypothetical protein [Oscillospiraceae bacterium]
MRRAVGACRVFPDAMPGWRLRSAMGEQTQFRRDSRARRFLYFYYETAAGLTVVPGDG